MSAVKYPAAFGPTGANVLRLLLVSHDCNVAGAQQSLLRILRWLRNNTDWNIGVLALGDGPLAPVYASLAPLLVLPDPGGADKGALNRITALTGGPPDIICGNTAVSARSYSLLSAFSVPMVTRVAELDDSMARYVDTSTRALLLKYSDAFVAVSKQVAEMLTVRMGVSPDRITIINGAVETVGTKLDAPRRADLLNRLGLTAETRLLWGCGSVSRRKGSDLFLGVTEELFALGVRDFHALWAGHPVDDLAAPLFLAKERSPSRCHISFLGQVPEPNLLMAPGDIFLLTSREDPFPLVSLEAAERGLPTLCFPGCGGMEAFVRDGGGLVSAGREPKDMARLALPLLENPAHAVLLGQEAQKLVLARHSMDSAGPAFVALFERLDSGADECVALVTSPRLIAFHLPQFHAIPENDEWWGKGFTEWTNVIKAQPLFDGHYQPHVPDDLGYYNLSKPYALKAQAALAQEYGIHGFCFYHYWFNGKLLLETPLHQMLKSGEPDFPFCLCWANEDWTRAWDGRSGEILVGQHYADADDVRHMYYLSSFFDDKRYIRIGGKPLFLVYRANQMPDPLRTTTTWREIARKLGHGEIYLCRVESFLDEHTDPVELGFDAAIEFQPDWVELGNVQPLDISEAENSSVYEYSDVVRQMIGKQASGYKRFPCVFPSWDNTPRRKTNAVVIHDSSPHVYKNWLKESIKKVKHNPVEEKIVFINAWNEWGEGNHLEPDTKFGRGYLEATQKTIEELAQETYRFTVSIIIPVNNEFDILPRCLEAIKRTISDITFELIIIDNGSADGTAIYLDTLAGSPVSLIRNAGDMGFGYACKQAANSAQGEHLVFMKCNPKVPRGWLNYLVGLMTEDYSLTAISANLQIDRDAANCSCDCVVVRHDVFNQIHTKIDIEAVFSDVAKSGLANVVQKLGYKSKYLPSYKNVVFRFNDDVYEQFDGNGWLGPDAIITVPDFLLKTPLNVTFHLFSPKLSMLDSKLLVVKIYVDGDQAQTYVFTRDNEGFFVQLQIPAISRNVSIKIQCKAYFVPELIGESDDFRKLSLLMQNLQYQNLQDLLYE